MKNNGVNWMSSCMLEINEKIYINLQKTSDINNEYCDYFNSFFRQKIGENFDFESLYSDLSVLQLRVSSDEIRASKIKEQYYSDYQQYENYIKLIDLLILYQDALYTRITLFCEVSRKLANRTSGIKTKYSYFAYKFDTKKLMKLEQNILKLGNVLQQYAVPFMQIARNV